MKSSRIACSIWLCLSFFVLHVGQSFASFPTGTRVATSDGLVAIEKLSVGDKVLSYDLNETDTNKKIIEVTVTEINKHIADSIFTLYTADGGWVEASPQQLLFTIKSTRDKTIEQASDTLVMDFVQAQYITTDYMLIDEHLTCVPITKAVRTELRTTYPQQYSEKIKRNRRNEITSIEKRIVNIDTYAIEVEEPHILLISDRSCDKTTSKPRLLLTHNGIPALAVGVSLAFGSTPASLSLAGVSASVGGLGVTLGPVGVALGVATGLGLLGYQLFKGNKKQETSFYIERSGPSGSGSPGGRDPKDDDEDKREKENEKLVVTQGKSNAPKKSIPNSVYEKIDNENKNIVTSRTTYDDNGYPTTRCDFYRGSNPHTHFDKGSSRILKNHKHIFRFNNKGQLLTSEKVVLIE